MAVVTRVAREMWTRLLRHLQERFAVEPLAKEQALRHLWLIPIVALLIAIEMGLGTSTIAVWAVMVIWGVTRGREDLRPYAGPIEGSWEATIVVTLGLMFLQELGMELGLLISGPDPQRLHAIELTAREFLQQAWLLPWVAGGEEVYKALLGLAFFSLLPVHSKGVRLVVASVAVGGIFGATHALYWPAAAVLPIGLTAIFDLVAMAYVRSLWPLVLAHLMRDALTFAGRYHSGIGPEAVKWLAVIGFTAFVVGVLRERQQRSANDEEVKGQ